FRYEELKWAGFWSGTVPVPLNWRCSVPELQYMLQDSAPTLVFVEGDFLEVMERPEFDAWRSRMVVIGDQGYRHSPGTEVLIEAARPQDPFVVDECADAILFYTGGTTGKGKAVRLSHRNVYINALQVAAYLRPLRSDVFLHVAPMFHTADLLATCFVLRGAANAYLPTAESLAVMTAIERSRATATTLAPTMVIRLLNDPNFVNHDLSSLRCLLFGASAMTEEWIVRLARALPDAALYHGYGLTETSPNISMLEPESIGGALRAGTHGKILRSCGKPVLGAQVRIVDDAGSALPRGSAGEVIVRGPNLMSGYLNRPEDTAKAVRDGWLHTGDVGMLDDEGNLYILDRIKDMIVTGGENVYSAEVEQAISAHEGVLEAAVFGLPDDTFGERVAACVVRNPEADLTSEALIAHCRTRIAGYKVPRSIFFVSALPKTAVGKVDKRKLREAHEAHAFKGAGA
ncbi:MAG TPA: AMP-binding protein, partial [Rariglobus sp.]